MTDPDVIFDVRDRLGVITLNRPRAINALTHPMVSAIFDILRRWSEDDRIQTVALTGAGDRGLCAGGDIVSIYHDAKDNNAGPDSATGRFWREEYTLNAYIARYPKPYVAIMDGLVMGGGVGVAAHGSHRVVTERSAVGMPETGIGFVPDVGGTYLLSRAPGELGAHLALTTARMNAADAIAAGFADHHVPLDRIPALLDALRTTEPDVAVAKVATPAPQSQLLADRDWIDDCYRADTVTEIVARLHGRDSQAAQRAAADILTKSPVAVSVALRAVRQAKTAASLEEALRSEYRISVAALTDHDLVEGIRAQVIDKDRNPRWRPATLAEITATDLDRYFAPLGAAELDL
jgi:enoyl-CoA hydratase